MTLILVRYLAISYWDSLEQIKLWKQNSKHLTAQKLGQETWYEDYSVEIVEIISKYTKEE